MELREVEYFLAVCRTLNFTRAAEQCGVSQPALTRGIQKLERELGGPLLARERGNTHLTALGRLVRPQLEEVATRSRALRLQAMQHARLDAADLRIGVLRSVGPARIAPVLARFRAAHPGVELRLLDAATELLAELLLRGECDAALMLRPEGGEDRLRADPLYAERLVVAASARHPFALKGEVTMQDLHGETLLERMECEAAAAFAAALRAAGAAVTVAVRSERLDWLQHLVALGVGVAVLPEHAVTLHGLAVTPLAAPEALREVCLVTVSGRRWSPPLAGLIEALRREDWHGPIRTAHRNHARPAVAAARRHPDS